MAKKANDLKEQTFTKKPVETKKTEKTIKVKFLEIIRADYGAFDAGDIAELNNDIAETLIKYGYCEEFKGEIIREESEEY